jgi:putative ABC transport system substrate-binding protein
MNRRYVIALCGAAALWPLTAAAQQQPLPSIGFLSSGSPRAFEKFTGAFAEGLSGQAFLEGRDVQIDYRWAEGHYDDLEKLASELVHKDVSVIAASGGLVSAQAAIKATSKIPIVFVSGFDPVWLGLVSSLNRPGGNVTGASVYSTELVAKRLELLTQLAPNVHDIAILVNPGSVTTDLEVKLAIQASQRLGRDLQVFKAVNENEIDVAFAAANQAHTGGFLVSADPLFTARRAQIVALAAQNSIPTMYPWREYVDAGGLVSYGAELTWAYRQIGDYAGQILKGAKPTDLPVVFPTKFNFIINLKTAKALSLNVPASLLAISDETIE